MRNYPFRSIVIICFIAALAGCGMSADNKAAQETADKFYTALKAGDVAAAAALCGTDELMTTKAWQDLFTQNLNSLGNVTSFKKGSGFHVTKNTGSSTVLLNYDVTYQYGESSDSLTIIDEGEGFKVFKYGPELVQAKFKDGLASAEKIAGQYFESLSRGDYPVAMSYIGYSGLNKYPPEEWTKFYTDMDNNPGKISSYKLDEESSISYVNIDYPDAGKGNVYSVMYITTRNGVEVTETVELFQPKFDDPIKIVNHFVK